MKSTAEMIAYEAGCNRGFDTITLVISHKPVELVHGRNYYARSSATFNDGSIIEWNYKNEVEVGYV